MSLILENNFIIVVLIRFHLVIF